jgi:hypothetical protein
MSQLRFGNKGFSLMKANKTRGSSSTKLMLTKLILEIEDIVRGNPAEDQNVSIGHDVL